MMMYFVSKFSLVAILTILLALSTLHLAPAHGIDVIDQKQEDHSGGMYPILGQNPIGQEFKPSLAVIVAVEVYIGAPQGGIYSGTVTLTLRQGAIDGSVLATESQLLEYWWNGWVYFALTPLSLTPDSTYIIQLSDATGYFYWGAASGNTYTRGRAILAGTPEGELDMAFRTYAQKQQHTKSNPVGGVITPVNQLAVLAPYLTLVGMIATISTVYAFKKKGKV